LSALEKEAMLITFWEQSVQNLVQKFFFVLCQLAKAKTLNIENPVSVLKHNRWNNQINF